MKIEAVKKIFISIFGNELAKEGFTEYKGTFYYIDRLNQWLKYVSLGTLAQGRLCRVCVHITPFTYRFDTNNMQYECLYDVHSICSALDPTHSIYAVDDAYRSATPKGLTGVLERYKSAVRPFIGNIFSFKDSVLAAENLARITGIGEYNDMQTIVTHAYMEDYKTVLGAIQAYISKLEKQVASIEDEQLYVQNLKCADELMPGICMRLQECKDELANVKQLDIECQNNDFSFLKKIAEASIANVNQQISKIPQGYIQK